MGDKKKMPKQRWRIYTFPGGERLRLTDVELVTVDADGVQFVTTADCNHAVSPGWLWISFDRSHEGEGEGS